MDGEIGNFIKVWAAATIAACYCYLLSKSTHKGLLRLVLILPVAALFAAAPFALSSCHFGGTTWFFLTWLGISKLLLLSWEAGPLSQPGLSLPCFVSALLLPIKIKPSPASDPPPGPKHDPLTKTGVALFGVKVVGFACVLEGYNHRQSMSSLGVWALYCCHLYLALDIILTVTGAMARGSLGLELAPQADEPYLSSSLQDFWGRRWNLMVSDILRQTIHKPIRSVASPLIGTISATIIGVLASFLVSGLMHEWIFYYLTHVAPTWEVTWFFVLHGTCLVAEVMIKAAVPDRWKLHRAVSGPLTVGFVTATAAWLFFPPLVRNKVHERAIDEYASVGNFVKTNVLYLFRPVADPELVD